MEDPEKKDIRRIDSLQILRGLAFLGVFTTHCKISSLGVWGVSIFIILSGFLMVNRYYDIKLSLSPICALKFAIRKIRKIYHLHIVMLIANLLIPVFFKGSTVLHEIKINAIKILLNVLMIQAWIPSSSWYFSMNDVAWYLSCCLFFYFTFPFVLWMIKHICSTSKLIIVMVLIYLLQIVVARLAGIANVPESVSDNFIKWLTYICPVFRWGDFCIGACLGAIFVRTKKKEIADISQQKSCSKNKGGVILYILAFGLFIFSQMIYSHEIPIRSVWINYFSSLFIPSSILLVWAFANDKGMIARLLSYRWLLWIGNYSAFSYLIHQAVIHYLGWTYYTVFGVQISTFLNVVLSLVVTIILSLLYKNIRLTRE